VIHGSPSTRPVSPTDEPVVRVHPSTTPTSAQSQAQAEPTTPSQVPTRDPAWNNVRSYSTRGGRAALALTARDARLVSATPNPGYETRVTKATGWLRVDFIERDHSSSVIATFYQHAPSVQVYEY
jgi:hypothetical protein